MKITSLWKDYEVYYNKENYSDTIENYTKKHKKSDYKKVNKDMNYLTDIGTLTKSKEGMIYML